MSMRTSTRAQLCDFAADTLNAHTGKVVQDLNKMLEQEISQLSLPSGVEANFINLTDFQQRYAQGAYPEFASNPVTDVPCLGVGEWGGSVGMVHIYT